MGSGVDVPFALTADPPRGGRLPGTRYQGSKARLADWIVAQVDGMPIRTVLDAFGGTGSVAYRFKQRGCAVTYNDLLAFNHQIGTALVENDSVRLSDDDVEHVLLRDPRFDYDNFIERTFGGIYFTDDENRFLDAACQNIARLPCRFRRALAWFALCQAALAKRPYNLFHRRNLYMRLADVPRSFGNKATWERPFEAHFRQFTNQANAAVFTASTCRATYGAAGAIDPVDVSGAAYDLVYLDPPYVNARGVGVDYLGFYHFLEGMVDYADWPSRIDRSSPHLRIRPEPCAWLAAATAQPAFAELFARFKDSAILVSYRSDGAVNPDAIAALLAAVKPTVRRVDRRAYQYALSTNRESAEVLLIGT